LRRRREQQQHRQQSQSRQYSAVHVPVCTNRQYRRLSQPGQYSTNRQYRAQAAGAARAVQYRTNRQFSSTGGWSSSSSCVPHCAITLHICWCNIACSWLIANAAGQLQVVCHLVCLVAVRWVPAQRCMLFVHTLQLLDVRTLNVLMHVCCCG
jgi:hypothetical protein